MAATSLWHIEGRLKDLISYVENPEKTVPNKEMQDFFDVFSYVKNPQKTDNGEFVSAINCLKETALQQMSPTLTGGISTITSASTLFPIWMGANIITQNRSRNG